jgi:hypothetical protein
VGQLRVDSDTHVSSEPVEARPSGDPVHVILRPRPELRGRLVPRGGDALRKSYWIAERGDRFTLRRGTISVAGDGAFRYIAHSLHEEATFVLTPWEGGPLVLLGRFRLGPEEIRDVGTVVLDDGRTMSGRVVDSAGQPIAGVVVRAELAAAPGIDDERPRSEATTDASGTFTLRRVPHAPVVVRTRHARLAPASVPESAGVGEIVLVPGAFLSARVLDAAGTPVPHASIELRPADGEPSDVVELFTGRDGSIAAGPLRPGEYDVFRQRPGKPPHSLGRIALRSGERTTAEWHAP